MAATNVPPNAGFHATSRPRSTVETHRVTRETRTDRRGDPRRDLAPPRGGACEHDGRSLFGDPRRHCPRHVLFDECGRRRARRCRDAHCVVSTPRRQRGRVLEVDSEHGHTAAELARQAGCRHRAAHAPRAIATVRRSPRPPRPTQDRPAAASTSPSGSFDPSGSSTPRSFKNSTASCTCSRDRAGPDGSNPIDDLRTSLADRSRAARLAPRTRAQLRSGHPSDAIGIDADPLRRVLDLARVDETFRRAQHRGQRDRRVDTLVVELEPYRSHTVAHVELLHAGGEGQVEQLGQLGPHLTGVGVDRVPPDEDEIEGVDEAQARRRAPVPSRACRSRRTPDRRCAHHRRRRRRWLRAARRPPSRVRA